MDTKNSKLKATGFNKPVVYVGNFRPPITGQKFVNQKLADLLIQHGTTLEVLASLPTRRKDDRFYKIAQICRIIALPARMLIARSCGSTHFVYSLLGGRSRIIDMINVCAARLLGYDINLYHHSSEFSQNRSRIMSVVLAISGRNATHIMASPKMGEDMVDTYGLDANFMFIDNSAYVDQPLTASRQERSPFRLGLLSNLTRSKGLDASIDTLEALLDMGYNCELILAGPAFSEEAKDCVDAAEQKFPKRVQVLGPVSGELKEKFFRDIDVFVFPSTHKHETQSLVVPEAQSFGCPVIVYDHGYVAENIPGNLAECIIPADRTFADQAALLVRSWIDNPRLFSTAQDISRDHFKTRHRKASAAVSNLANSLKESPSIHAPQI